MQYVGEYLRLHVANILGQFPDVDYVARSAFNRFYYAAFHECRRLLVDLEGSFSLKHSDIPKHLRGDFLRRIQRQLDHAAKKGALRGSEYSRLKSELHGSIRRLAITIEEAYSVRVIADYELDTAVLLGNRTFSLSGSKITDASRWEGLVGLQCARLRKVWVELGH